MKWRGGEGRGGGGIPDRGPAASDTLAKGGALITWSVVQIYGSGQIFMISDNLSVSEELFWPQIGTDASEKGIQGAS